MESYTRREAPTGARWWVVLDQDETVHALITGCRRMKDAQRIAGSFFPDIDGLHAIAWGVANSQQRTEARQAFHVTPAMCARLDIPPPPNPLPKPPTLKDQTARLQRHFAHAGGGE